MNFKNSKESKAYTLKDKLFILFVFLVTLRVAYKGFTTGEISLGKYGGTTYYEEDALFLSVSSLLITLSMLPVYFKKPTKFWSLTIAGILFLWFFFVLLLIRIS